MAEGGSAPAPVNIDQKVAAATELMSALERTVKFRRLYESGHTLYASATEGLILAFTKFFERYPYLHIEVHADRVELARTPILQAAARESEIPFRLFKDGIRQIRFHRGLSPREILDLLMILEMDMRQIREMGEDLVSLLWNKDFRAIDYVAVDEMDMGLGDEKEEDPRELEDLRQASTRLEGICAAFGSISASESVPTADASLAGGVAAETAAVNPAPHRRQELPYSEILQVLERDLGDVVQYVSAKVDRETLGEAIEGSLSNLVELYRGRSREEARDLGPFLRSVTEFYLKKMDLLELAHILRRVRDSDLLEEIEGGEKLFDEIVVEFRDTLSPATLLQYFNRTFRSDPGALHELVDVLGGRGVDLFLTVYPKVTSSSVRQDLRQYLRGRMGEASRELTSAFFRDAQQYAGEILELLGGEKSAVAPEVLAGYLRHSDPSVRLKACDIASSWSGPTRVKLLMQAVGDSDAQVRFRVLRGMEESGDSSFFPPLYKRVDDRDFVSTDPEEKRRTYRALCRCGGDPGFGVVRQVALRKPALINRNRSLESRRAALLSLWDVRTEKSIAFLQQGAASDDEELRRLCQEILKTGSAE